MIKIEINILKDGIQFFKNGEEFKVEIGSFEMVEDFNLKPKYELGKYQAVKFESDKVSMGIRFDYTSLETVDENFNKTIKQLKDNT